MFPHHVILEHVLGNTLEVAELAHERQLQLSALGVLTVFRRCMLHKIKFLRSFEVAHQTTEQRLVKVLLEMHIEASLGLEHLLTLGTLLLGVVLRDVL